MKYLTALAFAGLLLSPVAFPQDTESSADEDAAQNDEEFERLARQMDRLQSRPCDTTLYCVDALGWMIACEGCAAVPASPIYPPALIETVERWAVRGRITVTDLMKLHGQCR